VTVDHLVSAGYGVVRQWVVLGLCLLSAVAVSAQPAPSGAIEGAVTTQSRTVPLAGAVVTLRSGDRDVATLLADNTGRFRFQHVVDGRFQVVASLDGFTTTTVPAVVTGQKTVEVSVDLPIASMSEHVEVVAPVTIVPSAGTLSGTDTVNGKEIEQLTSGGGLQSALRLLASVIEVCCPTPFKSTMMPLRPRE